MAKRKRFIPFDIEEVTIHDAATDGRGVAKYEEKKIFTEFVVPQDIVKLHVFDKNKGLFAARLVALLTPSPYRITPKCKHFGLCGGCKWQMMDYQAQLSFKTKQVREIFKRVGQLTIPEVKPALPSLAQFYYRNKLEFSFGSRAWVAFEDLKSENVNIPALGFHGRGAFDKILNIDECHLQLPVISEILPQLRTFLLDNNIPFYHIREHKGYLRQLMFRSSHATNELMCVLIVKDEKPEYINLIFSFLNENFPQITDFLWVVNPKMNTAFSELPFYVWKGKPYITEKLGNFQFRISPTSFFQTNPQQAERLYDVAKNMLQSILPEGKTKHHIVYDLYTGTGSIAIYCSELAEKMVGVEYVESSIQDAAINCELNGITHIDFYAGDMKKVLNEEFVMKNGTPDVIISDPPRVGMDKGVVAQILQMLPQYIIYISCHPATQARDANAMRNHYDVIEVQPVDMFPQTAHVENVILMKKKDQIITAEMAEWEIQEEKED